MEIFSLTIIRCPELSASADFAHDGVGPHVGEVLRHHVDPLAGLGGLDDLPALIDRYGGGHFAEDADAVLKGRDCLGGMAWHGRADDHGVEFRPAEHIVEIEELLVSTQAFPGGGEVVRVDVADCLQVYAARRFTGGFEAGTASACSDDRQVDRFHRFSRVS